MFYHSSEGVHPFNIKMAPLFNILSFKDFIVCQGVAGEDGQWQLSATLQHCNPLKDKHRNTLHEHPEASPRLKFMDPGFSSSKGGCQYGFREILIF